MRPARHSARQAFTDEQGAYRCETMVYDRQLDTTYTILSEQETRREGYMSTPFDSRPARALLLAVWLTQAEAR